MSIVIGKYLIIFVKHVNNYLIKNIFIVLNAKVVILLNKKRIFIVKFALNVMVIYLNKQALKVINAKYV